VKFLARAVVTRLFTALVASVLFVAPCLAVDEKVEDKGGSKSAPMERTTKIAQELCSNIDSVMLHLSIPSAASKRVQRGIHAMLLYSGDFRVEAPSYNKGGAISDAQQITGDQLKEIILVMADRGLLEKAPKFHSECTKPDPKFPPPADSKPFEPLQTPQASVRITTNDEHWYTDYFVVIPEGQAPIVFQIFSQKVTGKAKEQLRELAGKSKFAESSYLRNKAVVDGVSIVVMAIGFPLSLLALVAGLLFVFLRKNQRGVGFVLLCISAGTFLLALAAPGIVNWTLASAQDEGFLPVAAELDKEIITLTGEDGAVYDTVFEEAFEFDGKDYALLKKLSGPDDATKDGEIVLMKLVQKNGETIFRVIEDDGEFQKVSAYAQKTFSN